MTRLQQTETTQKFGLLTEREIAILKHGYIAGTNSANNAAQPIVSDLEERISKAINISRQAIEALYKPSF